MFADFFFSYYFQPRMCTENKRYVATAEAKEIEMTMIEKRGYGASHIIYLYTKADRHTTYARTRTTCERRKKPRQQYQTLESVTSCYQILFCGM